MNAGTIAIDSDESATAQKHNPSRSARGFRLGPALYSAAGMAILYAIWWLAGIVVANSDDLSAFSNFAPTPTIARLLDMISSGEAIGMIVPSLARVGLGLLWAIVVGVPVGILIGWYRPMRDLSNMPFQFLRMISPLSWMPIAVMAFATWDGAIIFLVGIASVWPIIFSTSAGFRRIDPTWFKVAHNLGARIWHQLITVVLPAISQDVLTGIRLAVGVAWIVLVPAEYLGVTSGLGYAINDARDTLEYDRLAATIILIGLIGYIIDTFLSLMIQRLSWTRES